jgi:hypothetical protein
MTLFYDFKAILISDVNRPTEAPVEILNPIGRDRSE